MCSHIYEISEFHHGIEGKSIQEHQQVSSLITGISNQRPPQSRYNLDIRFMARTEFSQTKNKLSEPWRQSQKPLVIEILGSLDNKDLCVVTAPDQYLLCDSNWGKANNHTQLLLGHNKSNKK